MSRSTGLPRKKRHRARLSLALLPLPAGIVSGLVCLYRIVAELRAVVFDPAWSGTDFSGILVLALVSAACLTVGLVAVAWHPDRRALAPRWVSPVAVVDLGSRPTITQSSFVG